MPQPHAIAAKLFCFNHNIEYSFIDELHRFGLIEIEEEQDTVFIPEEQLPVLEKMVRLHVDLEINVKGIETINYLLQHMEHMQQEMTELRNRIEFNKNE